MPPQNPPLSRRSETKADAAPKSDLSRWNDMKADDGGRLKNSLRLWPLRVFALKIRANL
jgi:hypothetical protein